MTNMFALLKKIVLYSLIALGVMYGYRYMTGKSITTLPREIVNTLQQKGSTESTNPQYYKKNPADQMPSN